MITNLINKIITALQENPKQTTPHPPSPNKDEPIHILPQYQKVLNNTKTGVQVTVVCGGAGTGKSTFIQWLRKELSGQILVAAPTGISARNIQAPTIHSLFSLPPAETFNKDKDFNIPINRENFIHVKALVLDEVSMITSELLSAVSFALKQIRRDEDDNLRELPFGGLPLILVGDLLQLPPVINKEAIKHITTRHGGHHFFNSRSLDGLTCDFIELTQQYRQPDVTFCALLNDIRQGKNLQTTLETLNSHLRVTNAEKGSIIVTPTRSRAEAINQTHLNAIHRKVHRYQGVYYDPPHDGKSKDATLPAPYILTLKVGAQVMFVKNDALSSKRWVNGSMGVVKQLEDLGVEVELTNGLRVFVSQEAWKKYTYRWNPETKQTERREYDWYRQIPLTLAWAVTIHKSQGLTLDKVHIDFANGAFTTGQTYVALSRCREIRNITVSRSVMSSDILIDEEANTWLNHMRQQKQSHQSEPLHFPYIHTNDSLPS